MSSDGEGCLGMALAQIRSLPGSQAERDRLRWMAMRAFMSSTQQQKQQEVEKAATSDVMVAMEDVAMAIS